MKAEAVRIVVAEDDEMLRYCLARLLREHGYKVVEASDGFEVLNIFDRFDDAIHLLITDLDMPGMSGIQLVGILRNMNNKAKFLLVSGLPDVGPGLDIEFLPKPYSDTALVQKVGELLGFSGSPTQ